MLLMLLMLLLMLLMLPLMLLMFLVMLLYDAPGDAPVGANDAPGCAHVVLMVNSNRILCS